MASLAPFILSKAENPYVRSLVEECLRSFVRRALDRYEGWASDPSAARKVGVVGSFGCACEEFLRGVGKEFGMEFVRFLKSPIDELVNYHSRHVL